MQLPQVDLLLELTWREDRQLHTKSCRPDRSPRNIIGLFVGQVRLCASGAVGCERGFQIDERDLARSREKRRDRGPNGAISNNELTEKSN